MKIEEELEDDVVFGGKQMVTAGGSRRVEAKRAVVLAGARVLFYPTLLYNVFRHKIQPAFRWWDPVDQYLLLGAVPFPKDVPRLKKLGVGAVITLNEPYETLVPSSLYRAHGIEHLVIPTRDYLFAPSFVDINRAVEFIHKNACCGRTTYVHCKAGRGRSTTIVLCYLVKHKNMAPAYALEYVRSIRPRVALAASQWKAVQEYSKRRVDASAHSPSGDAVLITKSDLRLDISAHPPSCDAVLTTTADLQMDALSPSGEAVLVTKLDLEGYCSSCDDAGSGKELAVVPRIKARPMMARLSCLFASLKVSGAGGSVTRQLTEARAC